MKNFFLTLFFVILFETGFPNRVFSVNDNQRITEMKVLDNDSTFRYIYLYDNLGNKVLETKYNQQNDAWIRESQIEWYYEGSNCVAQFERVWKNNDYIMSYSIDYEYVNDQLITETHNTYSKGKASPFRKISFQHNLSILSSKSESYWRDGAWSLSQIDSFTYYVNGKTETITTSVYQSGSIIKQHLSTFSYYSDGTLASQLIKQKEVNNDWVNNELINWYYTPDSKQIQSQRNKKWITETLKWENTQKIEYLYNTNNKLVTETYQRWKTMFWGNDMQYDYEFNSNGLLEKKILSLPIYHHWQAVISIIYSDFVQNKANLMESQFDFWGGNTGELTTSFIPFMFNNEMAIQKGKRLQINYNSMIDDGIPTIDFFNSTQQIPVYPNPSVGIFYINTQKYAVQSWTVSDLNGRVLKKQMQLFNSGVIDITDLPNGLYILHVTTLEAQLTQKLIKK
ncbi:MAG TPA: T9SS type A sorting domain-containing protein [Paludibacter sp.]